jgi:hypothetical protein
VLGILSGCQNPRDLERFAIRHHSVKIEALGIELRRPPSDSTCRYFLRQVDVAALCAAIRDWTIGQISGGPADLDQLVCRQDPERLDRAQVWRRLGIHSQRRRDHQLGGQPAAGAAGRMAAGAPALFLRGHHGQDPGARGDDGTHEQRPG